MFFVGISLKILTYFTLWVWNPLLNEPALVCPLKDILDPDLETRPSFLKFLGFSFFYGVIKKGSLGDTSTLVRLAAL